MGLKRIVFFGTPAFAVPALGCLLDSAFEVAGVVTQPDKPRGRGQQTTAGPVKRLAEAAGLRVLQPMRLKDPAFLEAFDAFKADAAVVAAYGRILPESLIGRLPFGFINVHASLLPKYRGAAPVHRAILAGEDETGVSIMRIVPELDAGPVFAKTAVPIGADETAPQLEERLAKLGAELLMDVLDDLASGRAHEEPQDHAAATLAPKLSKDEGPIDWHWSARRIHDHVRGLHPWPHACAWLEGQRVIVVGTARTDLSAGNPGNRLPGEILIAEGGVLSVACGADERIQLTVLQPEGRRPMTAREFLAGRAVRTGQRFTGR
jgi:methionyl-tRNA formyltransferase